MIERVQGEEDSSSDTLALTALLQSKKRFPKKILPPLEIFIGRKYSIFVAAAALNALQGSEKHTGA